MNSKRTLKKQILKEKTTIYIKKMVCPRCIRVVKEELEKLGLDVRNVQLGEVVISGNSETIPIKQIKEALEANGFELIEDRRVKIIEKIKHAVLKLVQDNSDRKPAMVKQSEFLAKEVGFEYHYLSTLFSSVENITIEQYIILQKIERVKELLKYGELTLSEISYKTGYSSVQHLSNQFKSVTGMTPTKFRSMTSNTRKPIDNVK
jgi:AraC-like DNA-binding protein